MRDEHPPPVRPDFAPPHRTYAVTWLSLNGEEYTRLIGAASSDEAAAIVGRIDHMIRGNDHSSIDVRECLPVQTYLSRVQVER